MPDLRLSLSRRLLLIAVLWRWRLPSPQAQIYAWRDAARQPDHLGQAERSLREDVRGRRGPEVGVGPSAAVTARPTDTGSRNWPRRERTAYDDAIAEHASRNALNPDFVRAVIQAESGFNPRAVSPKGAMGLMQLMPGTAADYRVLDAFDPAGEHPRRRGVPQEPDVALRPRRVAGARGLQRGPRRRREIRPHRAARTERLATTSRRSAAASSHGAPPDRNHVFKTVQIVDGREVVRYTQQARRRRRVVRHGPTVPQIARPDPAPESRVPHVIHLFSLDSRLILYP